MIQAILRILDGENPACVFWGHRFKWPGFPRFVGKGIFRLQVPRFWYCERRGCMAYHVD
jgi:hypothetical protein